MRSCPVQLRPSERIDRHPVCELPARLHGSHRRLTALLAALLLIAGLLPVAAATAVSPASAQPPPAAAASLPTDPSNPSASAGSEDASGTITLSQDTTWTSNTTHLLETNVIVAAGVTLTVEAGTVVRADPGAWLRVDGTLIADGTAAAPITFTASSATGVVWSGLRFTDSSAGAEFDGGGSYLRGSLLRHVDVSYANTGVLLQSKAPYVGSSTFHHNSVGLDVGSSAARIEASALTTNTVGIGLSGGQPSITGSTLRGNGEGIRGSGSPSIIGNELSGNTSAAIDMAASLGAAGAPTVRDNRVIGNGSGIVLAMLPTAVVEHNVIAGTGTDLWLDVAAGSAGGGVRHNTLIGRGADNLVLDGAGAGQMTFAGNNWLGGSDNTVRLGAPGGVTVTLDGNYWGGLTAGQVPDRVFDCNDTPLGCNSAQSTAGKAVVSSVLSDPDQAAPAYVQGVAVTPAPLGLEKGTFDVTFSRPMSTSVPVDLSFHDVRRGTFGTLPLGTATTIEKDAGGRMWFACGYLGPSQPCGDRVDMYDGQAWHTFTPGNSGLPDGKIVAILGASNGDVWFAHYAGALTRLRGTTWTTYTAQTNANSLPGSGNANSLAEDSQGRIWSTWWGGGIVRFDGTAWRRFTTADGLPSNDVEGAARDNRGHMWFVYSVPRDQSTNDTNLVMYDGVRWTTYSAASGFACQDPSGMLADSQGRVWVACQGTGDTPPVAAMFDGNNWTFYSSANTDGVLQPGTGTFLEDSDGNIWASASQVFDGRRWRHRAPAGWGTLSFVRARFDDWNNLWYFLGFQGSGVYWDGEVHRVVDNGQWLTPTHYQVTHTVTSLVPSGTYSLTVAGAAGLDGMSIAPFSATFVISYTSPVTDATRPTLPTVTAAGDGSLSALDLHWSSQDPESGILQYRYALGTVVGGRDVLDWTTVPSTTVSVRLTGLSLAAGQTYYATVAARNARGVWSRYGLSNVVIGGTTTRWLYLPIVQQP